MVLKLVFLKHIFWFLLIIFQCAEVFSQVCVETKMGFREVPETYLYTYMEAYQKTNCLFWCTDTRVATAVGTRTVRKLVPEQINICCEGYIKDEHNNGNSIHCEPFCSPSCTNGYCKSPGVCVCNPGYISDSFDPNNCSPLCIKGCDHGTCTAPNTCQCNLGYNLVDEVCQPICSELCLHGSCVAPETCQCFPGYKKSENDTCEPYCSSYTVTGECVITIICEPGWTRVIKGLVEICEPDCAEPCYNGTCIAPETCECLNGYEKSVNDMCEPYCSSGCFHGSCISPETCVCDPGWYRKESRSTCLAHCDFKCGNGTCIAPNVCECFPGYKLDESQLLEGKDTTLCVPICDNCEGSCVAPGKCECDSSQEIMHVNTDGGPCDCMDNCSDDANKCERIICLETSTTTTVTAYAKDETFDDVILSIIIPSTTDTVGEYDNIVDSNHSDKNELKIDKASWFNSNWFYAVGSIFIMILILIVAAFMKKKYFKSLNRKIFNRHISDNDVSAAVHYKQNCA